MSEQGILLQDWAALYEAAIEFKNLRCWEWMNDWSRKSRDGRDRVLLRSGPIRRSASPERVSRFGRARQLLAPS
jgi:hypothetical protein